MDVVERHGGAAGGCWSWLDDNSKGGGVDLSFSLAFSEITGFDGDGVLLDTKRALRPSHGWLEKSPESGLQTCKTRKKCKLSPLLSGLATLRLARLDRAGRLRQDLGKALAWRNAPSFLSSSSPLGVLFSFAPRQAAAVLGSRRGRDLCSHSNFFEGGGELYIEEAAFEKGLGHVCL